MTEIVRILGANWCPDCIRAKQFLSDQRVPYLFFDVDRDLNAKQEALERNGGKLVIPVIEFPNGALLVEPDNAEIAKVLELKIEASKPQYDLVVVGAGPAGLTTGIYASREGIDTLLLDKGALGGQAGATERVDNYPGFPGGIGGEALATLYVDHARDSGVEMLSGVAVTAIRRNGRMVDVETDQGACYRAKAVVVATGSTYRRLGVPGESDLIGSGIHFCATCDGPFYRGAKNLVVVGGGNSGLEEGVFLSRFAERITIIQDLEELTASKILKNRVQNDSRFEILTSTKVLRFIGEEGKLRGVEVERHGEVSAIVTDGVFVFIGLTPNSGFLNGSLELDASGFISTSAAFATSLPGVFAAGDVRSGSTKQIAASVGEGAAVLLTVRDYLASIAA